ncbi:MAG: helix-turn-helix transcriptional regulator [Gemmatimonadetes bacterium]|nr:helix-turn-helix transcriptional regulator [Gemmatimonadota bacterium]
MAFPRTAVRIRHDGESAFVADPTVATVYNPGQSYERLPISADGDRSDWIAVSERVAREIVEVVDPASAELERPFRMAHAPVTDTVYLQQRRLIDRAASSTAPDALELEEVAISIVAATLSAGQTKPARRPGSRTKADRLAERTRRALMETLTENLTLTQLAQEVHASVFHLCRAFRQHTGFTIHEYRRVARLRRALELVPRYRGNLSALAIDLGFYSHSHFTAAFRRAFGAIPSEVAAMLPEEPLAHPSVA